MWFYAFVETKYWILIFVKEWSLDGFSVSSNVYCRVRTSPFVVTVGRKILLRVGLYEPEPYKNNIIIIIEMALISSSHNYT